ncbi:DNA damage-repair/toleration protein DRT100-like [Senna tora]|uniref:DNA damage-repair/toleration protein DRT100-like n=1 Tax=Senna tora TaxID=362788 RepID=A0A834TPC7_9FABA|nr:DNA damage-repair/toleration protein DRT100-like [Senna tora]
MAFLPLCIIVIIAVTSATVNSCPPSDRAALLAFKAALTGPYSGIFDSWTGTDCCVNWYGVVCDPTTHRVADINLRGDSDDQPILQKASGGRSGCLTGSISPEICRLDRLTNLVVSGWKGISGEIPSCITSLSSLRVLDLIGNQLSGEIPKDIGKMQQLTVLNLADNAISGEIPASIVYLAGLKHLDLSNNQISGEIPADFGKLRMLSRALLSRQIPPSLLSNPGMGILNLSRNGFEGTIPDVFGSKSYFMVLDLSHNNLNGPIPNSLSSTKFVGHLDLSNNHLCGSIPIGAPFDQFEAPSFSNNDCLCGNPLKTC